ncbi:MAG TPA: RcpC/CpaB family pilus assembly protein [Candidatus Dormibacteraeota bacterium]|nr:RcpC/CpaB family pilus assembly protein [Candidatus Dormibacteraeota bacterium]
MAVAPAATRPRPGGGRLFIIIGVLLAVVAFGAVFFLSSVTGGGTSIGGGPTTSVVIAKQSIPLRHQLTAADVEVAKASVNGNASLANTYAASTDVMGLVTEINITKGAIITSDMLAKDASLVPAGAAPAFLPLAKGYVAMTIPTGEQQGVAGHISLGDYITVIASASVSIFSTTTGQQQGPPRQVSKTVFTQLRIIGLGPAANGVQPASGGSSNTTTSGSAQNSGVTSSLTVEVTQCDAEYLTWFLANTSVRYTLESYKDYATPPTDNQDTTCAQITAAGGVSNKQVEAKYHFTAL